MDIVTQLLFGLWFFLPAGVANVTPIIAAHIPLLQKLNYPLDFYQSVHNIRIFGNHKTIRGFITGIIAGTIVALLQHVIPFPVSHDVYKQYNPFLLGIILSMGALVGDALKSFLKRRIGIQSGKTWLGADQIDYILGAILFSYWYVPLSAGQYLIIMIEWFVIHIMSTNIGYLLKLKKSPL